MYIWVDVHTVYNIAKNSAEAAAVRKSKIAAPILPRISEICHKS